MVNKKIPENVKHYIAGLFAGDGYISLYKRGNSASLRIGLKLCYKPTLDKICTILDAGNVKIRKKTEISIKNYHKQPWEWTLDSCNALEFLEMIETYLPEKGEQAKEAIKFQKWANKNLDVGKSLTKNKILYCEKMVKMLKILKKQFTTIDNVEKYDLFKKKHYNSDIESGLQGTLNEFDDDFFIISEEKKKVDDEAKKLISPDINLNVIENMTIQGFAGFFDAEGSVRVLKYKRYVNSIYHSLTVKISNSNFLILDRYCKEFGGTLSDPVISKNNGKIVWKWEITASNALKFLEKICSYTLEKREQIELATEFQTRRNNGTLTQEKAEYIYKKVTDLHHTEYTIDNKVIVLPYNNKKKEMDDNNNCYDDENLNNDENQSDLGF